MYFMIDEYTCRVYVTDQPRPPTPAHRPEVPNMASKNAFSYGTGQLFHFPPLAPPKGGLVIVGLDTKDVAGSHGLWRADAQDPAPQYLIDSIRKHGVLQPGKARKIDEDVAEVVMGRDRTKACRWLIENEGLDIKMPMLVWPKHATLAEMIGSANAENSARKNESLIAQAEGVYAQLKAEGYGNGSDEDAIKAVSVSTGRSAQRILNLLAFRADSALVKAYEKGTVKGEALMAIATLDDPDARAKELERVIKDPSSATIIEVRERVSYKKAEAKAAKAASAPPAKANTRKPAASKPPKEKGGRGISKNLARRLVKFEMGLVPTERHLEQDLIKLLRVVAGESDATIVPGMSAALKAAFE